MSDLDLTEAIEAGVDAVLADVTGEGPRLVAAIFAQTAVRAAAPIVERAVRLEDARMVHAEAERNGTHVSAGSGRSSIEGTPVTEPRMIMGPGTYSAMVGRDGRPWEFVSDTALRCPGCGGLVPFDEDITAGDLVAVMNAHRCDDLHSRLISSLQSRLEVARAATETRRVEALLRVAERHAPYPHPSRAGIIQCDYCAAQCHSRSGLACDSPADAVFPCPDIQDLAAGEGIEP